MYTITTLDDLRAYLGLIPGVEETRLLAALQAASAQIERLAGRRFCPRYATLSQRADRYHPGTVLLPDDLLQLEALTCDDVADVPLATIERIPNGDGPASMLVLGGWTCDAGGRLTISGWWGWHDAWSLAWRDSGAEVPPGGWSANDSLLPVDDTTGPDSVGESPRFQVGHLLRCGTELMRALAVTPDAITVQRGANGSTAAEHPAGTPIESYQPPADVRALVVRWSAWLYREADQAEPGAFPLGLTTALNPLRRERVR
ncbi:MAG: hypothetical protein ACOCZH_06855 [Phototrophicaceae bacterium]